MRIPAFLTILLLASTASAQWITSATIAKSRSESQGKPMLVAIYHSSQAPSKAHLKAIDGKVLRVELKRFVPLKVDVAKDLRGAMRRWQIDSFPTMLLIAPSGERIAILEGTQTEASIVQWTRRVMAARYDIPKLESQLKINPNDKSLYCKLAMAQALTLNLQTAIATLKKAGNYSGPVRVEAHVELARTAFGQQEFYISAEQYRLASAYSESKVSKAKWLLEAGKVMQHFGNYSAAIADCNRVIALNASPALNKAAQDLRKKAQSALAKEPKGA